MEEMWADQTTRFCSTRLDKPLLPVWYCVTLLRCWFVFLVKRVWASDLEDHRGSVNVLLNIIGSGSADSSEPKYSGIFLSTGNHLLVSQKQIVFLSELFGGNHSRQQQPAWLDLSCFKFCLCSVSVLLLVISEASVEEKWRLSQQQIGWLRHQAERWCSDGSKPRHFQGYALRRPWDGSSVQGQVFPSLENQPILWSDSAAVRSASVSESTKTLLICCCRENKNVSNVWHVRATSEELNSQKWAAACHWRTMRVNHLWTKHLAKHLANINELANRSG